MSTDYEVDLKGTHTTAQAAREKILKQMERYGNGNNKEAKKRQLQFSLNTLRTMCVAAKSKGAHFDVYCDIFSKILTPNIEPGASKEHWGRYMECVRYFHYVLVDKELYAEASLCFGYLMCEPQKLQNDSDYKIILSTYSQHLLLQRTRNKTNKEAAQKEIAVILEALTALFELMLQRNLDYNMQYPELVTDFVHCLMLKSSTNLLNFFSGLLAQKTAMLESFFRLLSDMKQPLPPQEQLQSYCQRQLEAFVVFMHYDVNDKLQQKMCLQHLRACRASSVLQKDTAIGYTTSLLYCYVKLVYNADKTANFKQVYVDACGKFNRFFEKSGDALVERKWFWDVLVLLAHMIGQLQQHAATPFTGFWEQMTWSDTYAATLQLIWACIKLAPHIAETKVAVWACCNSARKHTITSLMQAALSTYSSYVLNVQEKNAKERELEILTTINGTISKIVRRGIDIMDAMTCINSNSTDLKITFARYSQLTRDIKTPEQATVCARLGEDFAKLKAKFSTADWTILLRRIAKASASSSSEQLCSDMRICYIVALLQEPDHNLLRHQIGFFYSNKPTTCLLESYKQCNSALKSTLTAPQQHYLHWLEMQQFFKYYKTNAPLHKSLLLHSPTPYSTVLLARVGKLSQESAESLEAICQTFQQQTSNGKKPKRLEQLVFAHAYTKLLLERSEAQKNVFACEAKDCQEEVLEELLKRKELPMLNVSKELALIQMARQVLNAFQQFYDKADENYISCDEALIDWEFILDDLTAVGSFLQVSGYLEFAAQAWLLHYRIANNLDDHNSSLRSLSFFCEHAEHFEAQLDLSQEIANKQAIIIDNLQNLQSQLKRHQTQTLICLCQVAYFHARQGHFSYAQILLDLVQQQHQLLPERIAKYDVVLGTLEIVKFRILWKHASQLRVGDGSECTELVQSSLAREIEEALEHFREFISISSGDSILYTILLLNLLQEVAECAANRLNDQYVSCVLVSVLKLALQSGLALRTVQVMSMWMWINLQMEHVSKAQIKLQFIEIVMGVKSQQELLPVCDDVEFVVPEKKAKFVENPYESEILLVRAQPGMEEMRKQAQLHTSPVKVRNIRLSPTEKNCSLKRFLKYQSKDFCELSDLLQWNYFMIGCLNARLYFLAGDYDQLEDFYEHCQQWLLDHRKNKFLQMKYQNINLLCLQHQANFLRANKKFEKAIKCIEHALDCCREAQSNVDSVYSINFAIQLRETRLEMAQDTQAATVPTSFNSQSPSDFSCTPPDPSKVKAAPNATRLMKSAKKTVKANPNAAFIIYDSDEEEEEVKSQSSNSSGSKSEMNSCQPIEILELNESIGEPKVALSHKLKTPKLAKSAHAAIPMTEKKHKYERQRLMPAIASVRKATAPKVKKLTRAQSMETIDLSPIDLEEHKVVGKLQVTELAVEMQALEIATCSKAKIRNTRKLVVSKEAVSKTLFSSEQSEDSSPTLGVAGAVNKTRGRPRKAVTTPMATNDENMDPQELSTRRGILSSAAKATPCTNMATRRRRQNI